jgi:hypothetical protein
LLKALEIDINAGPARQGLATCGQQPPAPVEEQESRQGDRMTR